VAAIAAGLVFRVAGGRDAERMRAIGWVDRGATAAASARAGAFQTDMSIRPAVVVERKRIASKGRPASKTPVQHPPVVLAFPKAAPSQLVGWIAIEDDAAKLKGEGKHRVAITVEGEATPVFETAMAHRAGRVLIDVPIASPGGDLVVTIASEGDAPPLLGFDLELGVAAGGP
jgi:hypothetical protein